MKFDSISNKSSIFNQMVKTYQVAGSLKYFNILLRSAKANKCEKGNLSQRVDVKQELLTQLAFR